MAKLREGEKRVQLCFIRPEDRRLYEFMQGEAYRCRWELSTFILASLTEAFKDKMEEYEVEAIAQEAAQKVRERAVVSLPIQPVVENNGVPELAPPKVVPAVSMDQAANDAEAQIAQLDALASTMMAKRLSARKGVGVPPPPPPLPTSTQLDMDKPPALPRRKNSAASGSRS